MPRYKLTIEYDGTAFYGWQYQDHLKTVQGSIQEAVFKFTHEKVVVEGAGRTDAGVHALGQVAHIDLNNTYENFRIGDALNNYLKGSGASILKVEEVAPPFHARFSATSRQYMYHITNRRSPLTLNRLRAWHVILPLNIETMQTAAKILEGTHDFTSFRNSKCQAKSPIKTLDCFEITAHGQDIKAVIESRSFLHNQVRIMMGTLVLVGLGKWSLEDLKSALDNKNRVYSGPTAPPHGLYLNEVKY